jgi:hypothetical protein
MKLNGDLDVTGVIAGFTPFSPKIKQYTSTTTQANTVDTAITAFTAMTFPATPDGVKTFAVTFCMIADISTDGNVQAYLRLGTSGDISDGKVYTSGQTMDSSDNFGTVIYCGRFLVTPAENATLTISMDSSAGTWTLNAFANNRSNVIIEQVT